jgi:hypothetical protein
LACFEFKPIPKNKWLVKGISNNMCWAKGFKGTNTILRDINAPIDDYFPQRNQSSCGDVA